MAYTLETCCCFDLKTGGLIVGYLELFFSTILLLLCLADPISWAFVVGLLSFAACVAGVYGIYANKPKFGVPSMIAWFLVAVIFIIHTLILVFGAIFGLAVIPSLIKYDILSQDANTAKWTFLAIMWVMILLNGAIAALGLYFLQIKASVYTNMTRANQQPATNEFANLQFGNNCA